MLDLYIKSKIIYIHMKSSLINISNVTNNGTQLIDIIKEHLDNIEHRSDENPAFLLDIFYPHKTSSEFYDNLKSLGLDMISKEQFNNLFFNKKTLPLFLIDTNTKRFKIRFQHLQQKYGINKVCIMDTDRWGSSYNYHNIFFTSEIGAPIENYTIETRVNNCDLILEEINILNNINIIDFNKVEVYFDHFKTGIEVRDIHSLDIYPQIIDDIKGYFDSIPGGLVMEDLKINDIPVEEEPKNIYKGITLPFNYHNLKERGYDYHYPNYMETKELVSKKLEAFFNPEDGLCYTDEEVEKFVKFRERIPKNVRFNIWKGYYIFKRKK